MKVWQDLVHQQDLGAVANQSWKRSAHKFMIILEMTEKLDDENVKFEMYGIHVCKKRLRSEKALK